MKKLISLVAALAMVSAAAGAAMAADKTPAVYVNEGRIMFDDQEPVILGEGYTVVPARGVFEAMGAKVEWKEEERQVEVTSPDNKTLIRLTIDDSTMKVYDLSNLMSTLLSGQDFDAPETDYTLDVPAQIMNDRTMIPLRAISEALNANVNWDGEAYTIDIKTSDFSAGKSELPGYTLSSDVTEVNAGETVDLYISANNIPEDVFVSGVTATVAYDKENFEFVEASLINGDEKIEGALGATNPDFRNDYLKVAYVTIDMEKAVKTDGKVMKLTFKSINGKEGSFAISNGYHTRLGYNTSLLLNSTEEGKRAVTYDGDDFNIDTTSVVVNAGK